MKIILTCELETSEDGKFANKTFEEIKKEIEMEARESSEPSVRLISVEKGAE